MLKYVTTKKKKHQMRFFPFKSTCNKLIITLQRYQKNYRYNLCL